MKIAIPVNEKNMNGGVCVSFGRAPYFLVHDTESKEDTFLENTAAASAGGAGIKAAQFVVDSKADILLTPRCGENAADVLKAGNVKLYKTMNESIEDNIKAFNDEKLEILDELHAGFHGHKEV